MTKAGGKPQGLKGQIYRGCYALHNERAARSIPEGRPIEFNGDVKPR